MTGAPSPDASLSDDQLRTLVAYLGRVCLEIERGLRSPEHLRRFTDPRRPGLWAQQNTVGRFRGGPVQREDVGPPMLSRLSDGHAVATVVTRTEGNRWGAITLDLRTINGRWYVGDLQRILASAHYRTHTAAARDLPDQSLGRAL